MLTRRVNSMVKNKNVLITGGGGFIGTQLASILAAHNSVTLLDLSFDRNAYALTQLNKNGNVRTVTANILDTDGLTKAIGKAEVIIHAAAILGVQKVIQHPIETLQVNYLGTANILGAASHNKSCERFVLFSTSEIYGDNAFRVPENGNALLVGVHDTRWCYSISKLASEHLALGFFREKGVPVVVIRPFNVFGPGRIGSYAVLQFILRALTNEDLVVYGDGGQLRAWCYVDDFCDGVVRAMETPEAIGQAFNIGNSYNTVTNISLARQIVNLSGSRSRIIFKKLDFADIDIRVPNTAKAKEVLGFMPKVELEEGLTKTIAWVRNNLDAIRALVGG